MNNGHKANLLQHLPAATAPRKLRQEGLCSRPTWAKDGATLHRKIPFQEKVAADHGLREQRNSWKSGCRRSQKREADKRRTMGEGAVGRGAGLAECQSLGQLWQEMGAREFPGDETKTLTWPSSRGRETRQVK